MTDGEKVKGTLLECSEDKLVMECVTDAKKKVTEMKTLSFSEIREGKPVISFK